MREKYVRTEEIESEIEGDNLAAMDAFMSIFGYKRVKKTSKEDTPRNPLPTNIDYYEGRIARRMHWDEAEKSKFFGNLLVINENSYIIMMAKEIARKMYGENGFTVEYPSQEVYMINLGTFEVMPFKYIDIPNRKEYTLFKERGDANLAISIISKKFANESK